MNNTITICGSEYDCMLMIGRANGTIPRRELDGIFLGRGCDQSSANAGATQAVRRLINRKWIRSARGKLDRRVRELKITPAGRAALKKIESGLIVRSGRQDSGHTGATGKVRKLLERGKKSQSQIAREVGCSRQLVHHVKRSMEAGS